MVPFRRPNRLNSQTETHAAIGGAGGGSVATIAACGTSTNIAIEKAALFGGGLLEKRYAKSSLARRLSSIFTDELWSGKS